ncbi:hypothetical protein NE172_06320 [Clostridium botulinum]|uniref:Uncharacterized protein n=1 Tax=Clostridium botulinum TaxID=1491 RepID=A0A6B4JKB5_CLOBO|nr:hypothetical protein [Clostridium botulinum]EES48610.1 hypothetical protein CLO_2544 [Clostridium botulinum E1 str. 'BoNT E Beluga']MBY6760777.1 hypothetical protein [Clostridium botulinum]MBY6919931.1 hypothetical protein [Clostridium botulinum]MCR1130563.1 hypothetical protein [Clostridium botulinum]NFJ57466.1 hypothetical protein [Clostridium botulinum]
MNDIEKTIYNFFNKLREGKYGAILENNKSAYVKNDEIDVLIDIILANSPVRIKTTNDTLVIHNLDKRVTEYKGIENMLTSEYYFRRFLDDCFCGTLLIRKDLTQKEFEDDDFIDSEEFYKYCDSTIDFKIINNSIADILLRGGKRLLLEVL